MTVSELADMVSVKAVTVRRTTSTVMLRRRPSQMMSTAMSDSAVTTVKAKRETAGRLFRSGFPRSVRSKRTPPILACKRRTGGVFVCSLRNLDLEHESYSFGSISSIC